MYPLQIASIFYFLLNLPLHKGLTHDDLPVTVNHFSKHLATKTAYRFISNHDDTPINFPGCKPKKIWMVVRHGSRNPGKDTIAGMRETLPQLSLEIVHNHNEGKGELSSSVVTNISSWSPQVEKIDSKRLVHEGEDEMLELAERFQNRFPDILPEEYTNTTYKFRFTATQRTMESKRYFSIGLFGRRVARYVWTPPPLQKDLILRFYKACEKWEKEIKKNPETLSERRKFEESHLMKMSISNISRRLGYDHDLPIESIQLMYVTCGFESAWSPYLTSPWCYVFNEKELEVLEYAEDLEYYWVDGYGHSLTYLQACPMLKDMLHSLTSDEGPRATFYFSHSGTVLKVLAHLGLYKDKEKLTHATFNTKRLWRVGLIDAFATNLAFVLYQCEDGPKILTLHQERAVVLPGCKEELCPLDDITSTYHDTFFNCRFSELCRL